PPDPRRPGGKDRGRPLQPSHGEPEQPLRRPGPACGDPGHLLRWPRHRLGWPALRGTIVVPVQRSRTETSMIAPAEPAYGTDDALLVLEDGTITRGRASGARGVCMGEIVFATGMTGYQEAVTDPSYHRQIVRMTSPHIGTTGMNRQDPGSQRIWAT